MNNKDAIHSLNSLRILSVDIQQYKIGLMTYII